MALNSLMPAGQRPRRKLYRICRATFERCADAREKWMENEERCASSDYSCRFRSLSCVLLGFLSWDARVLERVTVAGDTFIVIRFMCS